MPNRFRALIAHAALLGFGCLLALGVAEVALRLYDPVGQRLLGDRIVLDRDQDVEFRNRANPSLAPLIRFHRNSLGFRGPDPPADFDERLTVVAIGGSTTEGLFLGEGKTWPIRMAARLRSSFPRLWVNNAGLDGHTTFGHLMLLDQIVLPLRPKVALFLIGLNDVGRDAPKGREVAHASPSLLTRLARSSAFASLVQNLGRRREAQSMHLEHRELDLRYVRELPPNRAHAQAVLAGDRERLEAFESRVDEIVRVCRAGGVEPVLLTQPALYSSGNDPDTGRQLRFFEVDEDRQIHAGLAWRRLEQYNEVTRAVGARQGVLVIDVARRLPGRFRDYYDWVHFTDAGADAVAAVVASELGPFLQARFPSSP